MRAYSRAWFGPYFALRRSLGLPETPRHPMVEGQYSPYGTLALFSSVMAQPQPDWPPKIVVAGFPFHDRFDASTRGLSVGTEEFLQRGDPPLVFTLGTSAVFDAGDFWDVSAEAARRLRRRAVFLVGTDFGGDVRSGPDLHISGYEPHSLLLRRAAAVIHQGGIGTTGQALRSGVPQVVVSFSHDQPDNGSRVEDTGAGLTLRRHRYSVERAVERLGRLLSDDGFCRNAAKIGELVRAEDGVACACDVIERTL
jgi:UDP:flavonoid glycosyltransferase YjiC (YdhE family)